MLLPLLGSRCRESGVGVVITVRILEILAAGIGVEVGILEILGVGVGS